MRKHERVKSRKRRNGKKNYLPKVKLLAAALYWTVRLILLLWDRYTR